MTDPAQPERPDVIEHKGEPPSGASNLNDEVAQQAASGISSPDADQHAGTEAPASEGQLPG